MNTHQVSIPLMHVSGHADGSLCGSTKSEHIFMSTISMLVEADIRPPIRVCLQARRSTVNRSPSLERFIFASSDRCMRLRDFNRGKKNT
jgi:hypothetical protein